MSSLSTHDEEIETLKTEVKRLQEVVADLIDTLKDCYIDDDLPFHFHLQEDSLKLSEEFYNKEK